MRCQFDDCCELMDRVGGRQYCNTHRCQSSRKNQLAREYLKKYRRKRHWLVKMECIDRLGGICNICGYKEDLRALQVDHIDPKEKRFKVVSLSSWSGSLTTGQLSSKAIEELSKCQLLCANCHAIKSSDEHKTGWYLA